MKKELTTMAVVLMAVFVLEGCRGRNNNAPSASETAAQETAITAFTETPVQAAESPTVQTETSQPVISEQPETASPTPQPEGTVIPTKKAKATATPQPAEKKETSAPKPKEEKCQVHNSEMGFSFTVSRNLSEKMKCKSVSEEYDEDFGIKRKAAEYYITLDGERQNLFTIYRMDKKMTAQELEDINPDMGYLKASKSATYTIVYAAEPNEGLSRESTEQFDAIMCDEVASIPDCFTVK